MTLCNKISKIKKFLFEIRKTENIQKYKILGLIFFEKKILKNKKKVYFLGLHIWTKKIKKLLSTVPCVNDMYLGDIIKIAAIQNNLTTKKESITTLVLGSSHAQFGWVDDDYSLNLGLGSQDLYYSYMLLKNFKSKLKKLKNIVLFYSVFSPKNDIQKGPFYQRSAYYKKFFNIPYKDVNFAKEKQMEKTELKYEKEYWPYAQKIAQRIDLNYPDFLMDDIPEHTLAEMQEMKKHDLKMNQGTEDIYLEKIIALTRDKGYRLFIVLSPYQRKYMDLFPDKEILFRAPIKYEKQYDNIKIIDLWSSNDLTEMDYLDETHLNKKGAKKINLILKTFL